MEYRISVDIEFMKGRKRTLTDVTEVGNPAMLVYEDRRGIRYGYPVVNVKSIRIYQYIDGAAV